MITFLGCFEIHADRPHWIGIKEGCEQAGIDARFVDIRRNKDFKDGGEIGIALTKDARNFLGGFKKKIWWHCDFETEMDCRGLDALIVSNPHIGVLSSVKCPLYFLPQGCPKYDFVRSERKEGVVFVGNPGRSTHIRRTNLLEDLQKEFVIEIVQNRWNLLNVYPQYKAALSINFRDDLFFCSNRPFLIMGHSGLCVAKENPLMRQVFEDGSVVYFSDLDDAKKKIADILENPARYEDVRRAGWDEIQRKHTYRHRMERLAEIIEFL